MRSRLLRKYTPSVPRLWLKLIAGLLWSCIGIMLCAMAFQWLSDMDPRIGFLGAVGGLGVGFFIFRFGFSKIAMKNISRIANHPQRVCIFAFQAWRSYFLILFMMLFGYFLRHSAVPRIALSLIYLAIGTGLTLSSSIYYLSVNR